MARILTTTQKKTIFTNLPANFTIDGVAFSSVSKKYANQITIDEDTTYPVISLNYAQDGIQSQVIDVGEGVVYWKCMLTIHVLAKHASGLNGATICEGIAQGIMDEVESWKTPLDTDNFDLFTIDDDDIKPLDNRGILQQFTGVYDYVFSINIWHL